MSRPPLCCARTSACFSAAIDAGEKSVAQRISRNDVSAVEFAPSWLIRHGERRAGYSTRQLLGEDSRSPQLAGPAAMLVDHQEVRRFVRA